MFSDHRRGKSWVCPSDRLLTLRSKMNIGWSVHSANLFRVVEVVSEEELRAIEEVIQRANHLEKLEFERVGRMRCRLDNMTKNIVRDEGRRKICSMCGMASKLFSRSFVHCVDCNKAVCEKCRVDTLTDSLDFCVLCKICSENREIWKKSGGWFYGQFPAVVAETCERAQLSGSPTPSRAFDTWAHRAPDIVRLQSFEPPEENHNDHSQFKDWTMSNSIPVIAHLQSFEPPEENHNDLSKYKDWTMCHSIPDFNSIDDFEVEEVGMDTFNKHSVESLNKWDSRYLTVVQGARLYSSLPDLQEECKLTRKDSVRRKKSRPKTIRLSYQ